MTAVTATSNVTTATTPELLAEDSPLRHPSKVGCFNKSGRSFAFDIEAHKHIVKARHVRQASMAHGEGLRHGVSHCSKSRSLRFLGRQHELCGGVGSHVRELVE